MNILEGKIALVESSANMSIVEVEHKGDIFSALVLETPETSDYLSLGMKVKVVFKETEVVIAKDLSGMISMRNRCASRIKSMAADKLLTRIVLDYKGIDVISIITTRSVQRLGLREGDTVDWLVKANEVSLMHV